MQSYIAHRQDLTLFVTFSSQRYVFGNTDVHSRLNKRYVEAGWQVLTVLNYMQENLSVQENGSCLYMKACVYTITFMRKKGHFSKFIIHKIRRSHKLEAQNLPNVSTGISVYTHKVHPATTMHFQFTTQHQLLQQSPLTPYTRALLLSHTHTSVAQLAREKMSIKKKQQWRWHSFTHGRRTRVQVLAGNILILYTGEEEKESLVIGNSPFISELK